MAGKVKTWVWVVLAIVVIGILGVVAMAGSRALLLFAARQTQSGLAGQRGARFRAGQGAISRVRSRSSSSTSTAAIFARTPIARRRPTSKPPDSINVLAFDPDDGRIVRVSIPFWLVRMKMRGATIDLNGNHMNLEDLKLTAEDLERFGPTLIVDHQNSDRRTRPRLVAIASALDSSR